MVGQRIAASVSCSEYVQYRNSAVSIRLVRSACGAWLRFFGIWMAITCSIGSPAYFKTLPKSLPGVFFDARSWFKLSFEDYGDATRRTNDHVRLQGSFTEDVCLFGRYSILPARMFVPQHFRQFDIERLVHWYGALKDLTDRVRCRMHALRKKPGRPRVVSHRTRHPLLRGISGRKPQR